MELGAPLGSKLGVKLGAALGERLGMELAAALSERLGRKLGAKLVLGSALVVGTDAWFRTCAECIT